MEPLRLHHSPPRDHHPILYQLLHPLTVLQPLLLPTVPLLLLIAPQPLLIQLLLPPMLHLLPRMEPPAASYGAPEASYGAPTYVEEDTGKGIDLTSIILPILALIGLSLLFPTYVSLTTVRKRRSADEAEGESASFKDTFIIFTAAATTTNLPIHL